MAMELGELMQLLSVFIAHSYEVFSGEPNRRSGTADMAQLIESTLGLNMADWWMPTNERYLCHVPKAKMIEAVTEACSADAPSHREDEEGRAIAATARRWMADAGCHPRCAVSAKHGGSGAGRGP